MDASTLICAKSDSDARIRLPASCDSEYDFHAVFTRTSNNGDVGFILLHSRQQVLLSLTGFGNKYAGLQKIDGRFADSNETRVDNNLQNNVKYDLKVQVRHKSIRAVMNGKELFMYRFETARFSLHDTWRMPDKKTFGVFTHSCEAQFQTIEFTEVLDAKSPQ